MWETCSYDTDPKYWCFVIILKLWLLVSCIPEMLAIIRKNAQKILTYFTDKYMNT